MKNEYTKKVHDILELYLLRLNKKEAIEFALLTDEWIKISKALEKDIKKLSELENITKNQLYNLSLYSRFKRESDLLIREYAQVAGGIISNGQFQYAKLGIESAQVMISLVNTNFNILNVNAANLAIGATREGTPLVEVLVKRYGENRDKAINTLIESMARGRGPIETARLIGTDLEGSLYNTLRIARTEQILIFREQQTNQYIESGVVKSKNWVAESDACPICLEGESNNPYELTVVMESHPNCRCAWSPNI